MNSTKYSEISRRAFLRRTACAAVGTVAMTSAIRDLRFMNAAVAQSAINDYKAMVCIFLQGGNDSNNLIIPTLQSQYNNYAQIRTPVLAIPQSAVLPVTSLDSDGNTYGLHPSCPELQTLFGEGKLAFLFNTGTLVYPLSRSEYLSGSTAMPPQLFSHADQQTQWQTSIPDQPPLTGWGGRCADLLESIQPNAPISLMVTLAGANTFEIGNIVSQYSVSTSGAISLSMPSTPSGGASTNRLPTLMNILGLPYTNLQSQAYAGVAEQAINNAGLLNKAIAGTAGTFWTVPFPTKITAPEGGNSFNSTLSPQLEMVARLIAAGSTPTASGGFGMKRQIFFCQVGGYDLHTGQTSYSNNSPNSVLLGAHTNLLAELSQSMNAFQRAMEQIGLSNNVTSFTASDFGRTFPSNGEGSDHGWGSHHLILGGAVNGQRTYGQFPALTVNGPNDTNTGRWIPTTAIDQYFATLATWFGVDSGNLSTVFPNLGHFATPNLGFI
ncbi:MAG TPA: DUF1501 domain-containing protein [Candidatus Baltobacteraceae bacterium]|jgi:uncharacterized protein (DUF1501 family)|nr:DUF1501 domain-containing protein [Candidatus Baltobacteraceae bacterium]